MKKSILVISFAVFATASSFAQDLTSKKGVPILPSEGEWALGVDPYPFFQYLGNTMNNSSDINGPTFDGSMRSGDHVVIWGKKVKDATTHYRAMVRLGFGSSKNNLVVRKDSTDGSSFTPVQYGNDEVKTSGNNIMLGAGIEKRRGTGRVQGYYGAEAMIGFGSSKTTHTFANAITADNPFPTTSYELQGGLYRIKEVKNGSTFNFGIRGFVGVEFFYMAKASIGGEIGWGIGMSSTGEGETTSEGWNGSSVETMKMPGPGKSSSFGIDTDMIGGSIRALFYF
jgi:hypothetical protein